MADAHIVSAYSAEQDGVRHLLSIPAVRQALRRVTEQGAITQEMLPDLREARRKAGMLWRTFVDLLLIALCPEKAMQGITTELLSWRDDESVRQEPPVLQVVVPIRKKPWGEHWNRGREPKRFDVSAEDRKRVVSYLTEREADVLALRSEKGLTRAETAKRLGITVPTVAYREDRILAKLAALDSGAVPEKSPWRQKGAGDAKRDDASNLDVLFRELEHARILSSATEEEDGETGRVRKCLKSHVFPNLRTMI